MVLHILYYSTHNCNSLYENEEENIIFFNTFMLQDNVAVYNHRFIQRDHSSIISISTVIDHKMRQFR